MKNILLIIAIFIMGCENIVYVNDDWIGSTPLILEPEKPVSMYDYIGQIDYVVDGDTIRIQGDYYRFYGVDSPESDQPYGQEAEDFLVNLIGTNDVFITITDTDFYGRYVCKIFLENDVYINKVMVENGYAWWYERYAPYDEILEQSQANARVNGIGLWVDENPIAPWDWRSM